MPRSTREHSIGLMLCSAVIPALVTLDGCTPRPMDETLLQEALAERAVASVRLAKAITRLCSVSTETLTERDACILDRRLALSQQEPAESMGIPPARLTGSGKQ